MLGTVFGIVSHAGNTLKLIISAFQRLPFLKPLEDQNSNSVLPRGMDLLSTSSGSWMLGFILQSASFALCDFCPPDPFFLHSHPGS